jgi:hypothetical protein
MKSRQSVRISDSDYGAKKGWRRAKEPKDASLLKALISGVRVAATAASTPKVCGNADQLLDSRQTTRSVDHPTGAPLGSLKTGSIPTFCSRWA